MNILWSDVGFIKGAVACFALLILGFFYSRFAHPSKTKQQSHGTTDHFRHRERPQMMEECRIYSTYLIHHLEKLLGNPNLPRDQSDALSHNISTLKMIIEGKTLEDQVYTRSQPALIPTRARRSPYPQVPFESDGQRKSFLDIMLKVTLHPFDRACE